MQAIRIHFGTVLMIIMIVAVALPLLVRGVGLESDAQCVPVILTCPCNMVMNPQTQQCEPGLNKHQCPCTDTTNGKTTKGTCQADQRCKGKTSEGQDGKSNEISAETLSKLGEAIKGIMDKLKGGGGGGGSPPPQSPPPGGGDQSNQSRCGAFASFSSLLPSQFGSHATSGSLIARNLENTLGSSNAQDPSCNNNPLLPLPINPINPIPQTNPILPLPINPILPNIGSQILSNLNNNTNLNTTPNTNKNPLPSQVPFTLTNNLLGNRSTVGVPQLGFSGDLKVVPKGASLFFAVQNGGGTVAGFYGGNILGDTPPESIITGWCKDRPWATNFLAKLVAPALFDGLCKWRGYQVGTPEEVPVIQNRKPAVAPKPKPPVVPEITIPTITAKVAIWAVPAVVPIGARTSIYWNTQGVTGCKETSPDGSFSQASVSGGAATVPLTAATTFTISCLTASSTPITDYVTVQIGK